VNESTVSLLLSVEMMLVTWPPFVVGEGGRRNERGATRIAIARLGQHLAVLIIGEVERIATPSCFRTRLSSWPLAL
jgi:hypothetical protein